MPSDSIVGFLDRAQAIRVLFPEQVEQLIRQPDIPHSNLSSLCDYLLSRGVLTQFQADALRDGRGQDLSFAGYPLLDVLGPCRGGTAYRAMHPSLRTPLVLRRYAPDAFAPTDEAKAVVDRARTFGAIHHPNLIPVLDAGEVQGIYYAVLEQPHEAADLGTMLAEVGGAMPGFLAAEYGVSVASALRAIHARGGWHGEVRPGLLVVGPLVSKPREDGTLRRRPAPNATVKLTETGLIPLTPPASVRRPDAEFLPFLPPERIESYSTDARGDIYGLGATLYMLLAGRPPITGDTPEVTLEQVRSAQPPALAALRPDLPAELVALVLKMLAKRPEDRPQTAAEVCAALAPFCRPGTPPAEPHAEAIPDAAPASSLKLVVSLPQTVPGAVPHGLPVAVVVPTEPPEPDAWGVDPSAFAEAHAASVAGAAYPRRRTVKESRKSNTWLWVGLGLCLHLSAVGLAIAALTGVFDSPRAPATNAEQRERQPEPPQKKREKNKNPNRDSDPQ